MSQSQAKLERRFLKRFTLPEHRALAAQQLAAGRAKCTTHKDHGKLNATLRRVP